MAQGNFLAELKRRNVYRVGVAYAVAAFMLLEVVSNAAPFFELPLWIGRALVLLLIAGFPAALCFAWAYEITPDGLKRTEEVAKDTSITHHTAHRLNIVIVVLLIALAGLYGADRFLPAHEAPGGGAQTATGGAPKAPVTENGISIAVLPFLNLSGDPSQEFFSDGMTEEITSALAKVSGLKVVGRTSAFEFKGQNKDLHAIGVALRATHILEGSVRKEGNQIRVTGQLIRADDGTHIWTENYDRELKSVFALQDDIAKSIAGALRVPLGLKAGGTLVASRTAETETHQQYLRAKAIFRARVIQATAVRQTIDIIEQVVAQDPTYAPAWALLAQAYGGEPSTTPFQFTAEEYRQRVDLALAKAEAAGRRSIELEPQDADSYVGLAFALQSRGRYLEAQNLYQQALKIDAFNPDLLHFYSQSLYFSGHVRDALAVRRQLSTLEPLVPNFNTWTATILNAAGQAEEALALFKALPIEQANRPANLIQIYISLGRGGDAAEVVLSYPTRYQPDLGAAAVRLLRMPPTAVAPKDVPDFAGTILAPVYLHVGDSERYFQDAFTGAERAVNAGYHYPGRTLWGPTYAPARKTERFKAFIRKAGLVDYWRARGWPDLCRPVGADDFECS